MDESVAHLLGDGCDRFQGGPKSVVPLSRHQGLDKDGVNGHIDVVFNRHHPRPVPALDQASEDPPVYRIDIDGHEIRLAGDTILVKKLHDVVGCDVFLVKINCRVLIANRNGTYSIDCSCVFKSTGRTQPARTLQAPAPLWPPLSLRYL